MLTTNLTHTVIGHSSKLCAHIGAVPETKRQFILAGFTGHGMPQVFLSARGIAFMVLDGIAFEETGLPAIFKAC